MLSAMLLGDRGILSNSLRPSGPGRCFHTTMKSGRQERRSTEELRVVLAGAGRMAQHHAAAIAASRLPASVVAVVDPSREARGSILEVVPNVREFATLEEALSEVTPDVVHVCTPPRTHADVALLAIEAGCHVYVEKPFAPSEGEAVRILNAAADRGLAVCPGHQLLFERPARETWDLLPALGEVQHMESYFAFRPVRGRSGQAPVCDEDQLLDVLPHPVYVLLAAFEVAGAPGPLEVTSLTVGKGTVHALLRRGSLTASLVVTLTGRPVDSYLRLVGTNGSLHADFVRGIVLRQIGPGSSGIDKLLAPYRTARHLALGTTTAMARRLVGRKKSYPGLQEIFEAFYAHIQADAPPPISAESVLETVRIQEQVAEALGCKPTKSPEGEFRESADGIVLVTGGTGFLGRFVVEELRSCGRPVRVLARRKPATWQRTLGVEYLSGDLGSGFDKSWLDGVSTVVHCAAATSGGWSEHQSASIDATRNLVDAMGDAGCRRLIHVSSIAVVDDCDSEIGESSPYLADPRGAGPYVWGKLESERLACSYGAKADVAVTVVRPGAIVNYDDFEPPGRLGKRIGNVFLAIGGSKEELGVVDVKFCARVIAGLTDSHTGSDVVHVLEPDLPTRRRLITQLVRRNPGLLVLWIPRWTVPPLGFLLVGLQKLLRPGSPAVDVGAVFANRKYESTLLESGAHSLTTADGSSVKL